jgi:1-pyrroline-5-carboxylate dehydrogenase
MASKQVEIPIIIGGREIRTGNLGKVVMPHDPQHVLGSYHMAGPEEVQLTIDTAVAAQAEWEKFRWKERRESEHLPEGR